MKRAKKTIESERQKTAEANIALESERQKAAVDTIRYVENVARSLGKTPLETCEIFGMSKDEYAIAKSLSAKAVEAAAI